MGNLVIFETLFSEKIKIIPILLIAILVKETEADDDDFNVLYKNGAYEFGYNNPDSYHYARGNRQNVVNGEFGGRNPKTGGIDNTVYTAGPRGFRPRGKNIIRKYDLNQSGPRAVGSKDDPLFDPYEDPSYNFSFRTKTYNRDENSNRLGDVSGRYSYTDDVGERHNVEYIAGKRTGFHVKTPFPDSNPRAYGPLYFRGRGRPIPRGRTSIQRGLDGSYKFVSAGPDQRRTETSDSTGHVRGSYTYLDDKGVQHSVHYIAGPETGYRVLKTVKGPHLPTVFPFNRPEIVPPDFYDYNDGDVFDTAATGHGRPGARPAEPDGATTEDDNGMGKDGDGFGGVTRPGGSRPFGFGDKKPLDEANSGYETDFDDLFGGTGGKKPAGNDGTGKGNGDIAGSSNKPSEDDFSKPSNEYIPPGEEGQYGSKGNGVGSGNGKQPTTTRPSTSGLGGSEGSDDLGLFGSGVKGPNSAEGNKGPFITIENPGKECQRCRGALITNVGDSYLTVPPGVSVRAHVQAVDLLPYSSRFPRPSDQYKADLALETEQLNSGKDRIVDEIGDDAATTEETTTEYYTTTMLPSNSTET
ncbi:collagen alpha-1(II) chain [Diorhabda sublineata]|uniref:collagen alpha-1(II) chain n=1 Tax=Diorhabda sublineata TaxID=1163346 RepID=UPI0024E0892B|nr:collagen alpha-1(II) chain [Diorhabda sublineata]